MRDIFLIFATLVFAGGCGTPPESKSVLARVGDAELTMDGLAAMMDTTSPGWPSRIPGEVAAWVETEVLVQEAKRTGIEDDAEFRAEWNEAYRRILAHRVMSGLMYSDTVSFTEETLRSYFQEHTQEFYLREDVAKLNMIAFETREQASAFSAGAVERNDWGGYLAERMRDPVFAAGILASRQEEYLTRRSIFPPEAWRVATALPLRNISFPVRSQAGFYVIQTLALYRQGAPAEFELVRDEVRSRLLIEYRREQASRFIGTLRTQFNVQVFVTPDQSMDSIRAFPNE